MISSHAWNTYFRTLLKKFIAIFTLLLLGHSSNGQNYFLNGDAVALGGNCFSVTPPVTWQNGALWYANQLDLNLPFNIEFNMNFGNIDNNGADGMVFVLQTVGTAAIGDQGFGLGFQGFNPSFGIEFDTFSNPANNDPTFDHVAFQQNGNVSHNNPSNLAGPVQTSATNINVEDGQDHLVRISWDPITQMVELYVDCVLRLSDQNNLIGSIFGGNNLVYWGFTGSTGGSFNNQVVCMSDSYSFEPLDADTVICAGQAVQLAVPGSSQAAVTWSPAIGLNDATLSNPVATPTTTTTYCYTYYGQCNQTYTDCVNITVEQSPVVSAGSDVSFCAGAVATLQGSCSDPLAQLTWTGTAPIGGGASSLNATVNQPGTFTLTATTPQAQCASNDEAMVTEIPLPSIDLPTSAQICPGETVLFNLGEGWDEVTWSDNTNGPTYEASSSGTISVTVVETGCSNSASVQVNQVNLPNLDLGPDQAICEGNSTTLSPAILCDWSDGTTGMTYTTISPGLYWGAHTISGCTVSDTVLITTIAPPTIELGSDVNICEGESIILQIPLSGTWQDGSVGTNYTATSQEQVIVTVTAGPCLVQDMVMVRTLVAPMIDMGLDVNYCIGEEHSIGFDGVGSGVIEWSTGDTTERIDVAKSGVYWVEVTNTCGSDRDSISVVFQACSASVFVPNTFTPDGDGINDVFLVYADFIKSARMQIFDRWGECIYDSTDLTQAWTGNVHGGNYYAEDGVYAYLITYISDFNEFKTIRGNIFLMR